MSGRLGRWRRARSGFWHAVVRAPRILGVALLGQALLIAPAPGQLTVEPEPEEEVEIDADAITYDAAADQVGASGNVVIRRGDVRLTAEQVRYDRKTSTAEAFGDVYFSSIEGWLRAERVHLDLDDETGALLQAEVASDRFGYSLRGDRIEKDTGQRYRIENGKFTTCRCAKGAPSWSITGKKLDVSLNGYGTLEEARFCILDVPVLYLPKLAVPVHSERQSGFLFPEVGFSNQRGFRVQQPFYWAISKSQDVTLTPSVETSARIGLTTQYRYALRRDLHGELEVAYYNEAIRGIASGTSTGGDRPPDIPENRWGVFGEHSQKLYGSDAYADVQVVGDDQFFREINAPGIDYGSQLAYRTRPFTTSRVGLLTKWERLALQGEALVYQDLVDKQSFALQRLPELRLSGQRFVGWGTRADLLSSLTNFQREESVDGLRLDLQPGLSTRLPLGRSFFGGISARFHETAYQLTDTIMAQTCTADADSVQGDCPDGSYCDRGRCRLHGTDDLTDDLRLPETQSRESVVLHADLRTELARVFDFPHFGLEKLKHTIEPQLEYLYVPDVDQDDLPVFDSLDRINRRNLISYGVASRLLGRWAREEHDKAATSNVSELARFSLIQSYDFERRIARFGSDGDASHLSDIDVALRINPSRITSIRAGANYDVVNGQIPAALVGIQLFEPLPQHDERDKRETIRNSLSVSYRFISQNVLQLLQGSMIVRITDHIGAIYATRYDILENQFLENFIGMRYISTCDCWSIDIGVSDTSNPNEVQLRAQVSLLGFGPRASLGGTPTRDGHPGS